MVLSIASFSNSLYSSMALRELTKPVGKDVCLNNESPELRTTSICIFTKTSTKKCLLVVKHFESNDNVECIFVM